MYRCLALVFLLAGCAPDHSDLPVVRSEFLRFVVIDAARSTGQVDVATTRYTSEEGWSVDLVPTMAGADRTFFESLSKRLAGYDRVLFQIGAPARVWRDPKLAKMLRPDQRILAESVGLAIHLDVLDYDAANFVNADLPDEMYEHVTAEYLVAAVERVREQERELSQPLLLSEAEMQSNKETPGSKTVELPIINLLEPGSKFPDEEEAKALLSGKSQVDGPSQPDGTSHPDTLLKFVYGRMLADPIYQDLRDKTKAEPQLEEQKQLLDDAVMRKLSRMLSKGQDRIAILVAGARMPALEQRLQDDLGLRRVSHEWVTAWDIR